MTHLPTRCHRSTRCHRGASIIAAGAAIAIVTLKRQRDAALALAHHDALTGLPNRRAAVRELHRRLATGAPPLLATLIDLNDFKMVNDTYGHLVGDALLCTIAARLRQQAARDGFAARLGGDEFLLLLPDDGTQVDLNDIRYALSRPAHLGAVTLTPRAGLGAALIEAPLSWHEVISRCDAALYRSKTDGGVAYYEPSIDTGAARTPPQRRRHRDQHPLPTISSGHHYND